MDSLLKNIASSILGVLAFFGTRLKPEKALPLTQEKQPVPDSLQNPGTSEETPRIVQSSTVEEDTVDRPQYLIDPEEYRHGGEGHALQRKRKTPKRRKTPGRRRKTASRGSKRRTRSGKRKRVYARK